MIRHLIKIIWNQRSGNAWLWAELTLVSLCLWFVVDDLYTRAVIWTTPLGFDIENTWLISLRTLTDESPDYRPQSDYDSTFGEDILTLLDRMRTYPGVEAVSLSQATSPYNGMNNSSKLSRIRPAGDTLYVDHVRRFFTTPDVAAVFRFANTDGSYSAIAAGMTVDQVVVSAEVADALFPEGNAVGQSISYRDDEPDTRIGAIAAPIRYGEFTKAQQLFFLPLLPSAIAADMGPGQFEFMEICLRTDGRDLDFAASFRRDMKRQLRYHNLYLLDVRSFDTIRARQLHSNLNDTKLYLSAVFFLLMNIFLGIVGTFWLRTQHRRTELGIRIALGSARSDLRRSLIQEGLLLLLPAFLFALLIAFNVGLREVVNVENIPFTLTRFLLCQLITFVLMSGMIILGIIYPTRGMRRLEVAEALRAE